MVEEYLKDTSWELFDEVKGRFSVWHKDDFELVLPASSKLKDYLIALDSALNNLSIYEKRSKDEIVEQLSN